MALQIFELTDGINLLFDVINDSEFIIKKIIFDDTEHLRILKINGGMLQIDKVYVFNDVYTFAVYDFLTKETEGVFDFLGVSSPFTKSSSLFITDEKYYNLSVDTRDIITFPFDITTQELATTHYNNAPLFYKFYILDQPIDFENDDFSIFDLDGYEINNYTVDSYGEDHVIHVDIENNNSYFYRLNDYTSECVFFESHYALQHSTTFDGNKITFRESKFIEAFGLHDSNDITDDFYYILELEDGSFKTYDVKCIPNHKTSYKITDHIILKQFVKSISLFSKTKNVNEIYNKNVRFLWFTDVRLRENEDNTFTYTKFNSNPENVVFKATKHQEITEEDLLNNLPESEYEHVVPNQYYIFESNKLVEHPEGNVFINSQSTDMCVLSYNEMEEFKPVENILEFETSEQDKEYSDFYNQNFKSVSNFTKYGDN